MGGSTRKKSRKIAAVATAVAMLMALAVGVYFGNYYHPGEWAFQCMNDSDQVKVVPLAEGDYAFVPAGLYERAQEGEGDSSGASLSFAPDDDVAAFVFYPGAKVGYRSYAPLARACAEKNMVFVIVRMPANFALFDANAASDAIDQVANVDRWYVGGHSLGGVAASMHVAKSPEDYNGLVLLASYPSEDLTRTRLDVLSIYGAEDKVLDAEGYENALTNLDGAHLQEVVIEGGNHAGFADYGPQKGDGEATILPQDQIAQTADALVTFSEG